MAVTEKSSRWKHRYQLALGAPKTGVNPMKYISLIVAIAFHEMSHALHPSGKHDTEFAALMTHFGAVMMYRYSTLFNKLLKYCIEEHRVKGSKGRSVSKKPKKPVRGKGYYIVKCQNVRGRKTKLAVLADAYEKTRQSLKKYNTDCEIEAYYWPEAGDPRYESWVGTYYRGYEPDDDTIPEKLASLNEDYDTDPFMRRRSRRRWLKRRK